MRDSAILGLIPITLLSACFYGDEFYWANDDQLNEALNACRVTYAEVTKIGDVLTVQRKQSAADPSKLSEAERAVETEARQCFDKYLADRDWLMTR
jgi:hypothetical protein